ncbi:hypothetical protein LOTGIDRAFT_175062 [Lottia gigantea]|uniref:C-type lectin domain-containing protein n=1 Tax=Lottia gigantea TaxID=225164 RepID=V3ZWK3_LOTGI|nr:hypothetical protein LOTGIDRAFT_175062 [Lottia gigantea]ESO95873.1 hypothetical protein LOTGIDRAFT_175062 [Lottia gigantea]
MMRLIVLLSIALAQYAYGCPNGYHSHNGSCYAAVGVRSTWPNAYSFCKSLNGSLAIVDTESERDYLHQFLNNRFGSKFVYYWVGATNLADGSWMWAESTRPVDNLHWSSGYPTDGSNSQHCLQMVVAHHYYFGDNNCEAKNAFVCETQDA